MWIIILVIILALAGFVDSLYFVMVHYGFTDSKPPEIPICPVNGQGTCETAAEAPQSEIFGLPNCIFGLGFYSFVLAAAAARLAFGFWPVPGILAGVSLIAAVMSIYLAYTLVFQIKILCPLCFTAHAINLSLAAIFVLLLMRQ
jgi:uncharacterized membrane protein